MSQSAVEIVRRMYESFQSGDAEGALAHFDAEVVVEAKGRPDTGIGRGREQVAKLVASWIAGFEAWREEVEEIRDIGGQVLVIATQYGRPRGSDMEVPYRYALLYEVREERITRMTMHRDEAEALEAAGGSSDVGE